MNLPQELARREERLKRLAEAKTVLEARAAERHAFEQAEYEAKMAERAQKARAHGQETPRQAPHASDARP